MDPIQPAVKADTLADDPDMFFDFNPNQPNSSDLNIQEARDFKDPDSAHNRVTFSSLSASNDSASSSAGFGYLPDDTDIFFSEDYSDNLDVFQY
jgi:hypothetical protein